MEPNEPPLDPPLQEHGYEGSYLTCAQVVQGSQLLRIARETHISHKTHDHTHTRVPRICWSPIAKRSAKFRGSHNLLLLLRKAK